MVPIEVPMLHVARLLAHGRLLIHVLLIYFQNLHIWDAENLSLIRCFLENFEIYCLLEIHQLKKLISVVNLTCITIQKLIVLLFVLTQYLKRIEVPSDQAIWLIEGQIALCISLVEKTALIMFIGILIDIPLQG